MKQRIRDILDGAVDLHVHPGPSPFPRRIGIRQAAEQAAEAGFAAILVKSHHHSMLSDIAAVESSGGPLPLPVLGGVALNNYVGGLNPVAVELAVNRGGRIVWFPTISSDRHICAHSDELRFPHTDDALTVGDAIRVLDEDGALVDAAEEVLDLIAENDLILSTGHMSPPEVTAVLEAAKAKGITRLLVNHPNFVIEADEDLVRRWIELGAVVEHSLCMYDDRSSFCNWEPDELVRLIDLLGVENTIFGSDLGQKGNPLPVEGYERVLGDLLDRGVTDEQLRTMVVHNTTRLAGLGA
ncbi:DUF6282 family protein [Herbiconiux sp. KACC 21604]|uniref:DUF6282 family protein n=1 Tax=unclassified Herbiconiux TaxID=2618217 RepID=UPI001491A6F8|nr:DUF6282 family protein [Herbiconiux sp. SALV-R1]QJU54975.1 hypothetical protein HL652_16010 [Herbiconiux sp. SALV-R1]WPO86101.1 DUF6282 family protein [Herbiconiux sp. KACC 21604]